MIMAAHVAAVVKSKNIGNAIKTTDKIKKNMVTINTFKSDFPDIKKQVLESFQVMPRHQIEEVVLDLCRGMDTGLVYYASSGRKITVYTSYMFGEWLDSLDTDTIIAFNGQELKVVDAKPVLICGSLCIRCSDGKSSDQYDCVELYKAGILG